MKYPTVHAVFEHLGGDLNVIDLTGHVVIESGNGTRLLFDDPAHVACVTDRDGNNQYYLLLCTGGEWTVTTCTQTGG